MYPTDINYAKLHPINSIKAMYNFDDPADPVPSVDGNRNVWYIMYTACYGRENEELYTPYGLGTREWESIRLFKFDRGIHETAQYIGLEEPLKPNDILEKLHPANPDHFGICDYNDPNRPCTFAVSYGVNPFPQAWILNRWFTLTKFEKKDNENDLYIPTREYTYRIRTHVVYCHDPSNPINLTESSRSEQPFFQKYGHADIVLKNEKGAMGHGTLKADGYSIGWKTTYYYSDNMYIEFTFRGNYATAKPSAAPVFVISMRASFEAAVQIFFNSSDPDFENAPDTIVKLTANQRKDVVFSANMVVNQSEGTAEVEPNPIPETKDEPVGNKYDHLLNVPKTLYTTSPAVLKSVNSVYEMAIQTNGAIELISRHHSSSHKLARSIHRHLWIGLALDASQKNSGEDYWYLIGGESDEPSYRTIKKAIISSYSDPMHGDQYREGQIRGYIRSLDLYFKASVTILTASNEDKSTIMDILDSSTLPYPRVKIELASPRGFKGYLDIVSNIRFGFYDDGPIKIDLPPNKTFTFMGY